MALVDSPGLKSTVRSMIQESHSRASTWYLYTHAGKTLIYIKINIRVELLASTGERTGLKYKTWGWRDGSELGPLRTQV